MLAFFDNISLIFSNLLDQLKYNPEAPMLFSSGVFWIIFILFLPIYVALKNSRAKMVFFVIVFSLFFYYKSSGIFFLLIVATSLIDWLLSWAIFRSKSRGRRRLIMWLSIAVSLSVLGYFKYANFFLWNWNMMVKGNYQPLDIILPVGISFYTFQSISYVVDVYKRRITPTRKWTDYVFYLSFFPQLVAGPIVRADYFLPQLRKNLRPTPEMVWGGLWLIIVGIVKKALISDYIAQFNDLIFEFPERYSGLESFMGLIGYPLQVYCDFSGYSDMAIGLALIMGFRLGINFDSPFQSRNIQDFWRRWHISLSSWLRDYIYIPLGGNRKGVIRTYVNNFITMIAAGLWHGAAWKFVIFGAVHGSGLAVHKACKPWLNKIPNNFTVSTVSWLLTMVFVAFTLAFFRAPSFDEAFLIIKNIFTDFEIRQLPQFFETRMAWCIMIIALIVMHMVPQRWADRVQDEFVRAPWLDKLLVFIVTVQLVIEFMSAEVQPFIYFQF